MGSRRARWVKGNREENGGNKEEERGGRRMGEWLQDQFMFHSLIMSELCRPWLVPVPKPSKIVKKSHLRETDIVLNLPTFRIFLRLNI